MISHSRDPRYEEFRSDFLDRQRINSGPYLDSKAAVTASICALDPRVTAAADYILPMPFTLKSMALKRIA